jgi:ribulose-5-phosphate 4-epimerase/fuculose-1-phosphate aldolase
VTSSDLSLRAELVEAARAMNGLGINRGTSGNASVRGGAGFLVTPSALPYDRMGVADFVEMTLEGTPLDAIRPPSSEWRFHRDLYAARNDVGALIHTHAPFATTLACLDLPIPAFHYMVAKAGGNDIRCAGYATFGTQALSDHVVAAMEGRRACLMSHHGMIAAGTTLDAALGLAVEVEQLAEMYWRALQIETPTLLDDEEMARVARQFATYGRSTVG